MTLSEQWIVIGITGVTCGGKTTLANKLKDKFGSCMVLHQDDYFHPDDSPLHVNVLGMNNKINTDVISCLDMKRMHDDVKNIIESKNSENNQTNVKNILVVEGFCLLNYKPIAQLCHLKYAFILKKNVCLQRRSNRVYPKPDLPEYFELCAWPEHLKQHEDVKDQPGIIIINGEDHNLCERVSTDIEMLLKE